MKIDIALLDNLTEQAKASPRLRMHFDLRNSPDDSSQRMLNALEPGTQLPIHRHMKSSETIVMLRGRAIEHYYDDNGHLTDSILLEAGGPCPMLSVELGQWHRLESLESGTVIFEAKDGKYEAIGENDIMDIQSRR